MRVLAKVGDVAAGHGQAVGIDFARRGMRLPFCDPIGWIGFTRCWSCEPIGCVGLVRWTPVEPEGCEPRLRAITGWLDECDLATLSPLRGERCELLRSVLGTSDGRCHSSRVACTTLRGTGLNRREAPS